MCFHDFSWFLETSGMVPELFYKNVPESLYVENWGFARCDPGLTDV